MNYKIEPWEHQKLAIARASLLPYFGLFFDMGSGKSGTAINILRTHFNDRKKLLRTIIFAPPIVVSNWRDEWSKHSTIDLKKVQLLRQSGANRLKLFKSLAFDESGNSRGGVFVTNYESLLMTDLFAEFSRWAPEAIIFDESHELKNPSAKRSKLAETLANPFDKKKKVALPKPLTYILTGTPVLNSPMDLFQQFKILDGGVTFGHNFYAFRARYFRDKNAGMPKGRYFPKWELLPHAVEEMNTLIYRHAMRVTKAECMDLPPLVDMTVKVGMTPEQARMYKEMKQDFITTVKDQACVATLAITKAQRLMQIASGYIKVVEGEEIALEDTPKMEALKQLLTELTPNHKVLIWAVWRKNYGEIEKVCSDLGLVCTQIVGGLSEHQRDENKRRFLQDPEVKVLVGNPGSGGVGINLCVADYAICYSRNFSLKEYEQARARNHRGGSEIHEKITWIDLVCEGTIDELVQRKLSEKKDMSLALLRDLSQEMLAEES